MQELKKFNDPDSRVDCCCAILLFCVRHNNLRFENTITTLPTSHNFLSFVYILLSWISFAKDLLKQLNDMVHDNKLTKEGIFIEVLLSCISFAKKHGLLSDCLFFLFNLFRFR